MKVSEKNKVANLLQRKISLQKQSVVSSRCSERGFSLIEVVIGLMIGLLGITVMLQAFQMTEERRRTTTSGSDALTIGAIALYDLQRNIRQAGYGYSSTRLLNCKITLPSGADIPLAPVIINPGASVIPSGDANTDTLLVIVGNSNTEPQGNLILSQFSSNPIIVQMPSGFVANDYVIVAPDVCPSSSPYLLLDRVVSVGTTSVTLATGGSGTAIYNFGQSPKILAYAVRNGSLRVCDYLSNNCSTDLSDSAWVPIAGNIAGLRAQYGHDTSVPMDGVFDVYDQTTPTNACGWSRITASRIAVVARSSQYETRLNSVGRRVCNPVTSSAPVWDGGVANNPLGSTATPLDVSKLVDGGDSSDWQCYRYKVFQTVVPLRNIAWMGVQSGC